MLGDIKQKSGAAAQQLAGVCCDDGSVFQFYGSRGVPCGSQMLLGSRGGTAEGGVDTGLIEE